MKAQKASNDRPQECAATDPRADALGNDAVAPSGLRVSASQRLVRLPRLAFFVMGAIALGAALAADAPAPAKPWTNDFTKSTIGKVPDDSAMLVLNGEFVVKQEGDNRYLELPGTPLDTFGVLFGPEQLAASEVSAKIRGSSVGKLFPEFGVGSNGASGFKLWLRPGQNAVELRFGSETDVIKRVEYKAWNSGEWTHLRLRVTPAGEGKYLAQGKVWPAGAAEPAEWTIAHEHTEMVDPGQATVWGHPYSDRAIGFDDLAVTPLAGPAAKP